MKVLVGRDDVCFGWMMMMLGSYDFVLEVGGCRGKAWKVAEGQRRKVPASACCCRQRHNI